MLWTNGFSPLCFRYCGSTIPPVVTSTNNVLTVLFISDTSVANEGFTASYVGLNATTCMCSYHSNFATVSLYNLFLYPTTIIIIILICLSVVCASVHLLTLDFWNSYFCLSDLDELWNNEILLLRFSTKYNRSILYTDSMFQNVLHKVVHYQKKFSIMTTLWGTVFFFIIPKLHHI